MKSQGKEVIVSHFQGYLQEYYQNWPAVLQKMSNFI